MARIAFSRVRQLFLYAALASGCASWLPAPAPMRTLVDRASPTTQARCLLVLLPGIGDSAEVFAQHGFIAAIRKRNLSIDIISANASLGYYARRTVVRRIETDILAGARKAGYEQIWFGGVSLGGLGSLLMAQQIGRELAGIILVAPYLGDVRVQAEIVHGGGVARWTPPTKLDDGSLEHRLWGWLKAATEKPDTAPPIYLLSGDQDKLLLGHRLLGAVLPRERQFRTRGAHDWGPWLRLWTDFLDRSDFSARCANAPAPSAGSES